ncbi:hypothetical protein R9C00_14005 [Flammeovirgaceae bacterium SG7u.111]|nr:hypothetical protein [Flammeovirgaceae bacterium SG7u.132]WPO38569.1 hypothetical protein R9C00_14005 [Flammeovirgaceae bacterium SG7u.111]
MEIHDYDALLTELSDEITKKPEQKYWILLNALEKTSCPYLKKMIAELEVKLREKTQNATGQNNKQQL